MVKYPADGEVLSYKQKNRFHIDVENLQILFLEKNHGFSTSFLLVHLKAYPISHPWDPSSFQTDEAPAVERIPQLRVGHL